MRKTDVVSAIAERTGLPRVDVLVALEGFFKEVKKQVTSGEPVYIRGFGTFQTQHRAAKTGRNIKKNETVQIPAHNIPKFKPAKEFITAVKENVVDEKEYAE